MYTDMVSFVCERSHSLKDGENDWRKADPRQEDYLESSYCNQVGNEGMNQSWTL